MQIRKKGNYKTFKKNKYRLKKYLWNIKKSYRTEIMFPMHNNFFEKYTLFFFYNTRFPLKGKPIVRDKPITFIYSIVISLRQNQNKYIDNNYFFIYSFFSRFVILLNVYICVRRTFFVLFLKYSELFLKIITIA